MTNEQRSWLEVMTRQYGYDMDRDAIVAALAEIDRLTTERDALIGQRTVKDSIGRGWWVYADAPEDQQGFPPPILVANYSDAAGAIWTATEKEVETR
jgi:hypothetical protein